MHQLRGHFICEVWNFSRREVVLKPEAVGADEALFDVDRTGQVTLGLDSLDALEIAMRLEETFDVRIPDDFDPHDIATPRAIARLVRRLAAEGVR